MLHAACERKYSPQALCSLTRAWQLRRLSVCATRQCLIFGAIVKECGNVNEKASSTASRSGLNRRSKSTRGVALLRLSVLYRRPCCEDPQYFARDRSRRHPCEDNCPSRKAYFAPPAPQPDAHARAHQPTTHGRGRILWANPIPAGVSGTVTHEARGRAEAASPNPPHTMAFMLCARAWSHMGHCHLAYAWCSARSRQSMQRK